MNRWVYLFILFFFKKALFDIDSSIELLVFATLNLTINENLIDSMYPKYKHD